MALTDWAGRKLEMLEEMTKGADSSKDDVNKVWALVARARATLRSPRRTVHTGAIGGRACSGSKLVPPCVADVGPRDQAARAGGGARAAGEYPCEYPCECLIEYP